MKNRIDSKFEGLRVKGTKALITFITAGDPDISTTGKLVLKMKESGADIVELGVPFSDPIADGPTIQKASERALIHHTSLKNVLHLVAGLRKKTDIPIVLLTYYNPVLKYGLARFCKDARLSGVDGVIIPDLSCEESNPLRDECVKNNVKLILLLAPTSPTSRVKMIAGCADGFIYYVSLTGVTGARKEISRDVITNLNAIKRQTAMPVCVGFGISNPEQAKIIAKYADGVIVGSAIVRLIEGNLKNRYLVKKAGSFVRSLARAVHGK
ncbi:MAG: tryptophan synthase subunit alpha [Candidatus Omnitrophica bacterium]|nr:tryptophan synthase subunit alpha [Candidatus Omnitrophota bacterium]